MPEQPVDLDTLQPEADRTARREAAGQIPTKRYDPGQDRERTRGKIAERLVWTLIGLIAATFVLLVVNIAVCSGNTCNATVTNLENVKTIITLLLTPIVGLVGAVTGFYYGAKSGGDS
jgi:hypothetical protein